MKHIDDAFFNLEIDIPQDLGKIIDIPVKTSTLTLNLKLNRPADYYQGKEMAVRLSFNGPGGDYVYYQAMGEEFKLPVTASISFSHLALGEYYVTVFVPGSEMWSKQNIKLEETARELQIDLQPGADLKFQILAPGGAQGDRNVAFNLLTQEGKSPGANSWPITYDYMTKTYRGLPRGEYTLSILSSKAKKKQQAEGSRRENRDEIFPAMPEYRGEERKIVIDDQSPELIDLGTIELKPSLK